MRRLSLFPHDKRQRGQNLVEFAMVLPVFAVMLAAILEFGFAFDADLALEAASRQGARTGAALGNDGTQGICPNALAATTVDLTSVQITIYLADPNGNNTTGSFNTFAWVNGSPTGHFNETAHHWDACGRHDGTFGGGIYDDVGVQVQFVYHSQTGLLSFFTGGLSMSARAWGFPSRFTERAYWFSTSWRPDSSCATSMYVAWRRSIGSKPLTTMGNPYFAASSSYST